MKDATPQGMPDADATGHEGTEIQSRGLFISAGVLVATVIVCQVVLGFWMRSFERKRNRVDARFPNRQAIEVGQFPQPRLQESPTGDMVDMIREERARITTYGWVDQDAGIAHIPIDRAMEILAAKGLPRVPAPHRTAGAPRDTSIPKAEKRDEPGPEEDQPSRRKKESGGIEKKQGGTS